MKARLFSIFLVGCCCFMAVYSIVAPFCTVTQAAGSFVQDNYLFEECQTIQGTKTCKSYQDYVETFGQEWCITEKHRYQGARACAILSCIFFYVAFFFMTEKTCRCVKIFREGFLFHAHKILTASGTVTSIAGFIIEMLMYTDIPEGCVSQNGKSWSDETGAKIGGSPFLLLGCFIISIIALIFERKFVAKEEEVEQKARDLATAAGAAGTTQQAFLQQEHNNNNDISSRSSQIVMTAGGPDSQPADSIIPDTTSVSSQQHHHHDDGMMSDTEDENPQYNNNNNSNVRVRTSSISLPEQQKSSGSFGNPYQSTPSEIYKI